MTYILDADWAIEALAGRPHAFHVLTELAPAGIAISWITVGEIYEGAYGFPNPEGHLASFREFIKPLRMLNLDDLIMERFAALRADLRRRGQLIPDFDLLLASTALRHDLMVLTFNIDIMIQMQDGGVYEVQDNWDRYLVRVNPTTMLSHDRYLADDASYINTNIVFTHFVAAGLWCQTGVITDCGVNMR